MKQLFFVFSFLLVASFSSNAQCSKTAAAGKACCASKKTAAVLNETNDATQVASAYMEADAAAAANENIMKRTCEMSGTTSYFEKSVCADSGKVSWEEVKFDESTKTFTRVASAGMEKDENGDKVPAKACAGKQEGKACCAKKAGTN